MIKLRTILSEIRIIPGNITEKMVMELVWEIESKGKHQISLRKLIGKYYWGSEQMVSSTMFNDIITKLSKTELMSLYKELLNLKNKIDEIKLFNKPTPDMILDYVRKTEKFDIAEDILVELGWGNNILDQTPKEFLNTLKPNELLHVWNELHDRESIDEIKIINPKSITIHMVSVLYNKLLYTDGASDDRWKINNKYGIRPNGVDEVFEKLSQSQLTNYYFDLLALSKKYNINEIKIIKPGQQPANIIKTKYEDENDPESGYDDFDYPRIKEILEKNYNKFKKLDYNRDGIYRYLKQLASHGNVEAYKDETVDGLLFDFHVFIRSF